MAMLKDAVIADTLSAVRIVYLDQATTKWWNAKRDRDEPIAFCGWFWVKGGDEAGPFRTRSAAIRAAYYQHVLNREQPRNGHQALNRAGKKHPTPAGQKRTRETSPALVAAE
jgi:hypothetical protein